MRFTTLQGQYLAFIRTYSVINRRPRSEANMQRFFGVTAPSVHHMVLTLENRGLISRTAGVARSTRVLVPAEDLAPLHGR
jgi:Mn-dependent DtxR family transcriptional regulator